MEIFKPDEETVGTCAQFQPLAEAIRLSSVSYNLRKKTEAMNGCMANCGKVKQACTDLIHGYPECEGALDS